MLGSTQHSAHQRIYTNVVTWQYLEEVNLNLSTSNESIASLTTALVRLKLYNYLEELEDWVLYYDTDSVIFVSKEWICDLTGDLEGVYDVGSYITEFVFRWPTNYAY